MKYIVALLALLSLNANAATTISTTLTLTSPSAIISMTGVSATAYLRNISTTAIQANSISVTTISSTYAVRAWVTFNGNSGSVAIVDQQNVSSVTRISTGYYGVSFTTPMANANYAPICTPQRASANELFATTSDSPSSTTTGFLVKSSSAAGVTDTGAMHCAVFGRQ